MSYTTGRDPGIDDIEGTDEGKLSRVQHASQEHERQGVNKEVDRRHTLR